MMLQVADDLTESAFSPLFFVKPASKDHHRKKAISRHSPYGLGLVPFRRGFLFFDIFFTLMLFTFSIS